jgi:hypothetical protein
VAKWRSGEVDGSVHVVVPTHTPRYLDFVLVGLARQTVRAATVVVSCDTDDAGIGEVIERWAPRLGMRVWWVRRAHHGGERLCQVRNNGVRHLTQGLGISSGRLVILDGDTVASDSCLEGHARMGERADLVYPFRVDVPEARSAAISAEGVLSGADVLTVSADDALKLERRHRRYRRQLFMRRIGLGPAHKPKLLGGHFSVSLETYVRLNGFDEHYQGWGFKDDEFAYRAARLGVGCVVAVRDLIVFHLYHRTRQGAGRMADLPTAERFRRRALLPLVAENGIERPIEQNAVEVSVFG